MKAKYNNQDDIPSGLEQFYHEDGGEYHLQVDGLVPKSTVDEFRNNNIKLNKELQKVQDTLSNVDLDEYKTLKTERQQIADQELISAGKLDELLAQRTERLRTDYESRFEKMQADSQADKTKAQEYETQFNTMIVENQLKDAALKAGVRPEAIEDVLYRGKRVWRRTDSNGIEAYEGETPAYGKQGQPLTKDEWFEGLADQAPHLFKSSHGSGAAGGAGSQGRRISRFDQDALNSNLEAIAEGRVVLGD